MLTAVDTNILAYAEGVNGATRQAEAGIVIRRVEPQSIVIPVQVLAELFNVLTRKAKRPAHDAQVAVRRWSQSYRVEASSAAIMTAALDLSVTHQLVIWDAVILSVASVSGCTVLLSEDMQDGFVWRGTTVRNPFGTKGPH